MNPAPELLAEVFRGPQLESQHFGHIAVVDAEGEILFVAGSPEQVVHLRSAAKPFQALPALRNGVQQKFGFSAAELALACASHNGEQKHIVAAASMLRKIGLDWNALQCGAHRPIGVDIGAVPDSPPWNSLHNNCSGKHSLMLAACVKNGWAIENYLSLNHPHQQRILNTLAEMAGVSAESIPVNIDGCSAPEFALPLKNLAKAYAQLAALPKSEQNSFDVMIAHPEMVGGNARFDTAIMLDAGGKLIAKIGAEGLQCIAIRGEKKLGIAISIVDGNNRANGAIAIQLLKKLGIMRQADFSHALPWAEPVVKNVVGWDVGKISCVYPF